MSNARWIGALAVLGMAAALGGCGQTREALGLSKQAPDEFQVVARAPLSLPPDYNLRPPQPGAPRPQEGTARDQAQKTVFGNSNLSPGGALGLEPGGALASTDPAAASLGAAGPGASAGEAAFLESAGAAHADPSIRQTIDQETKDLVAQDSQFVDRLVFWRDAEPFGTVVDPAQEQQRLQENAALGKPVTEGDTPTIKRKKRALLEGIF